MSRVVLVGPDVTLEHQARLLLGDQVLSIPPGAPEAVLARLLKLTTWPQLIVFGSYVTDEQSRALAQTLRRSVPTLAVSTVEATLPAELIAAGISHALPASAELEDIDALIVTAGERAAREASLMGAPRELKDRGQVVVVTAPKGGVGKTTIATNVATVLAAVHPHRVVLVDLDLQFGDVAEALALQPLRTIDEAVGPAASRDLLLVKHALTTHPSGLLVLAAPLSPAGADGITAHEISLLLRQLAHEYAAVVVDTSPGLSEHTLGAIEEADAVISVTSPDITSVRGLVKELDVLTELDLLPAQHHVVLNLSERRAARKREIEQVLGRAITHEIPRTSAVGRSTNRGVPVVADTPRDRAAGRLRELGRQIADHADPTRRSKPKKVR